MAAHNPISNARHRRALRLALTTSVAMLFGAQALAQVSVERPAPGSATFDGAHVDRPSTSLVPDFGIAGGVRQGIVWEPSPIMVTPPPATPQPTIRTEGAGLMACQSTGPNSGTLTVAISGQYRTILPGTVCVSSVKAFWDYNQNGAIDNIQKREPWQPAHNRFFISRNGDDKLPFPRVPRLLGMTGIWVHDQGAAFSKPGGIVVWAEFSSWKQVYRHQFVALHMSLTKTPDGKDVLTPTDLFAGDVNTPAALPNNQSSHGVVMADTGNSPLKLAIDQTVSRLPNNPPPTPGGPVRSVDVGRIKGSTEGFVRFVDPLGNIYAATIVFNFDAPLIEDCKKKKPAVCN